MTAPTSPKDPAAAIPTPSPDHPPRPDAHVAEARRLAYVAMTRARRDLILAAHGRSESGARQEPSPFLEEARAAVDGVLEEVGDAPERAVLAAVADAQAALTQATMRAATAVAAGEDDAEALIDRVEAAARGLVAARADALTPAPAPPVTAPTAGAPASTSPPGIATYRDWSTAVPLHHTTASPARLHPPAHRLAARRGSEAHYRPAASAATATTGAPFRRRYETPGRARRRAEARQAGTARRRVPRPPERLVKSGSRPVAVERRSPDGRPAPVHGQRDRLDRHGDGGYQLDRLQDRPRRRARRRAARMTPP